MKRATHELNVVRIVLRISARPPPLRPDDLGCARLVVGLKLSAELDLRSGAVDGYCRYTGHMSKQVTATDAKATILRLLDDAAAGEEIEITRHGRPVARLVPASGARSLKGSFEGVAMTAVDEEQLFSTGERWNAA